MRLVTIDSGNTNKTVALHNDKGILSIQFLQNFKFEKEDFILISNVGKKPEVKESYQLSQHREKNAFFDMPINYALSLGEDRLYASYWAFKNLKENESVLVVDAGTFITVDFVDTKGFHGGYIFPGINRFLNSYTQSSLLPKLDAKALTDVKNEELPHSTNEAILKATKVYLAGSLNEVIRATSPSRIIVTGGSAEYLKANISLEVHVELIHHLVHLGLAQSFRSHLQSKFSS